MEKDTQSLLSDCTAGVDLALTAMDGLLPAVEDQSLRRKLRESMRDHKALRAQLRQALTEAGSREKPAAPVRKGLTLLHHTARMAMGGDDTTAAYLIAGSCDNSVKTLCRSRNRFVNAAPEAKSLAESLIRCEEALSNSLRGYM